MKDKWLEKWKNDHYLRKQCYLWTGVSLLLLSITILFFILLKRFVIGSFQNLDSMYELKPSASTFLLQCDGIEVDALGYSLLLSRFLSALSGITKVFQRVVLEISSFSLSPTSGA